MMPNFQSTPRRLLCVAVISMAVVLYSFSGPQSAYAADRGPVEICSNGLDDDADGAIDETTQGGCYSADVIGTPESDDGIEPEEWADNPSCADLGYRFGFKIEGQGSDDYTGTFTFTSADGILTGGASEDPSNSVTLSSDGTYLDWTSTIPLDAVIMKGANNSNAYIYDPEYTGDTNLASPGAAAALSHVEFCYDYELDVSKDATPQFTRTYDWTITKDDDGEYWKFIGDTATSHGYEVSVDQTVTDSDWNVVGTIYIDNNTPFGARIESVSDVVSTDIIAVVECDEELPYTLVAGGSLECSYSANLPDGSDRVNAAIVETSGDVGGGEAVADVAFGGPTTVAGYPDINVTDTNGQSWWASDDAAWTYDQDFTCPTDTSLYDENGVYSFNQANTATINETGQYDDATVIVNCYIWKVSKTANGFYQDKYGWDITKTVDPASQSGFAGDTLSWEWSITWNSYFVGEVNHAVSGVITINNPAPKELTVDLADRLTGGFAATVTCNDGDGGTDLTIAANSSGTCNYTAAPGAMLAQNTATATRNSVSVSDTVNVNWVKVGDVGLDANISDSNHANIPVDSTQPYKYTDSHTCSTDEGNYDLDGTYSGGASNTATITWTNGSGDSTADTEYTCYLPAFAKVVKTTTEGDEDIGQFPFSFELYDPAGALVETKTLGTGGGEVTFSSEIRSDGTWTIIEVLPDGFVSTTDTECSFEVAFPGSANHTYTCTFDNVEMSRVDLLKTTDGVVNPDVGWIFEIYDGPDGFCNQDSPPDDCEALATDTSAGKNDGILDFGLLNLNPFSTYTICELNVPAGYSSRFEWLIEGVADPVVPYNPNADDTTPEDVGHRCVDFGFGTDYALLPGEILSFNVDNTFPGGNPRTPGYWKNWNMCSGGNQQYTATKNAGYDGLSSDLEASEARAEEGYFLIEDVISYNGPGIVWDDILSDDFEFMIDSCALAVDILDKRLVDDPTIVGDGRKKASDPLHNLAAHLLAAQLNFGAGACTTQDVLDLALEAERLLDKYNFDGNGHDPLNKKSFDAELANYLAGELDAYNNGDYCGDFED